MLATKISFMNEIANFCDRVGADVMAVRNGIATDHRIGKHFLFPGVGYGGSCFPKDVKALCRTAEEFGHEMSILCAVDRINEAQKHVLVEKVKKHFGKRLAGKTLAVWGLSFKPQTDDMREAPAKVIIRHLTAAGVKIRAFDPAAMEQAREPYNLKDLIDAGQVVLCESSFDALQGAAALIVVTEWNEFRQPSFEKIKEVLTEPVIFDGRNIYTPGLLKKLGFTYYSIGRDALVR
jgi:UDPglucose 6-dehydrogenase